MSRVIQWIAVVILGIGLYQVYHNQKLLTFKLSNVQTTCIQQAPHKPETNGSLCKPGEFANIQRPWPIIQARVKNTIVQVFSEIAQFNWLQPYMTPAQGEAYGTGFFIDSNGYILTNAHVISQAQAVAIQVPALGKERLDAHIVAVSFDRDIALLRVSDEAYKTIKQAIGAIPFVGLGDSNKVSRGDEIMTLGYPLGQEYLKSTVGVISGRENVEFRQYLQIDAAINPGNSGGPSLNMDGDVIGINTANIPNAQNVGYIIPINEIKVILSDLYKLDGSKNKLLRKPYLGIIYNAASRELNTYLGNPAGGIYIAEVYKQSLLYKAGVRKGDVIHEINGQKIDHYGQLTVSWCEDKISLENYVAYLKLGESITLTLYRKGERKDIVTKFEHSPLPAVRTVYPDFEPVDYEVCAGMVFMELTRNHLPMLLNQSPTLIKFGEPKSQFEPTLVITHIFPDSAAQRSRVLTVGSRVKEVNDQKVNTLAQLRQAILKGADRGFLRLRTTDGVVAVFPLKQVIKDEPRLSFIYRYPISQTVQQLQQAYK